MVQPYHNHIVELDISRSIHAYDKSIFHVSEVANKFLTHKSLKFQVLFVWTLEALEN